jgi:hypothetical protein
VRPPEPDEEGGRRCVDGVDLTCVWCVSACCRACYADADILIMDDPLSALDAEVSTEPTHQSAAGPSGNASLMRIASRTHEIIIASNSTSTRQALRWPRVVWCHVRWGSTCSSRR